MRTLLVKVALFALFVVLYTLPQHHTTFWALGYVAFVPFLLGFLWRPRVYDHLLGFLAWWGYALLGVIWLKSFGTLAWLAATPLYAIPFYFLGGLTRRARWRLGLPCVLAFPVLFTALEWLRIQLSPGQLSLLMAGYSQVALTKLIQIVDITGVYGLCFLLALWNGYLADLALRWIAGGDDSEGSNGPGRLRRPLLCGAALVLLTGAVVAYGFVRDTTSRESEGPRVAVVQPNLPHYPPQFEEENRQTWRLQLAYTESRIPAGEVDLVLWPENALADPLVTGGEPDPDYMAQLEALTRTLGAELLVDSGETTGESTGWGYHTIYHLSEEGRILDRTRKVYLLPWTEYVPFADTLDWVFLGEPFRRLLVRAVGFLPGARPGSLDQVEPFVLTGTATGIEARFGAPICFESATPSVPRALARKGARFLVNPSSEGLLGDSVYRQTLIINAFRAVENRTTVVRATNTGISCVIDANGRVRQFLQGDRTGGLIEEPGVMITRVPLDARAGTTFYTRFGDLFVWTILGLAGVLVVVAFARKERAEVV